MYVLVSPVAEAHSSAVEKLDAGRADYNLCPAWLSGLVLNDSQPCNDELDWKELGSRFIDLLGTQTCIPSVQSPPPSPPPPPPPPSPSPPPPPPPPCPPPPRPSRQSWCRWGRAWWACPPSARDPGGSLAATGGGCLYRKGTILSPSVRDKLWTSRGWLTGTKQSRNGRDIFYG